MGTVQTIRRAPIYKDVDEGLEYTFLPVDDSITVTETETGYEARYLVADDERADGPDERGDVNLFLVNYHRDFEVKRDAVIVEGDLANWYRKDFEKYEGGKLPQAEEYHIFPLSCLIHSGVWLSLHRSFACDSGGWDTSHVGAVLVSRGEWPDEGKAYEAAAGLVETWNQYLTGDVYGIVKETYDKDKNQIDHDSVWGFYGYKYALEALKTDL
jgi:hypothetical protein